MDIGIRLLAVLGLVMMNGFFVATEFSLVSVRRSRIEALVEEGHQRARPVLSAIRDLDAYIAATQLGITIASIGLGWVGEPALARLLDPFFESILPENLAYLSAHTAAFIIAFATITFLHVVFGELAPKSLALQYPENIAMAVATPTRVFLNIFRPIIYSMNWVGQAFLRLIGVQPAVGHSLIYTEEELRMIVTASKQGGELYETEEEIIRRAFVFHDYAADDIMVPRTELVAIPVDAAPGSILATITSHKFGRYPVYERDMDDIVGVLYVKDLVPRIAGRPVTSTLDVRSVMRPVLTVPSSIPIDNLLDEMKLRRTHVAIVVDEYGGTAGMVTLDDIMERVVGEVPDEFDRPGQDIIQERDGSVRVNGLTLVTDVEEYFELELDVEDTNTIGGYVFSALGHRPELHDEVDVGTHLIRVEQLDGLRIAEVRFTPKEGNGRHDQLSEDHVEL